MGSNSIFKGQKKIKSFYWCKYISKNTSAQEFNAFNQKILPLIDIKGVICICFPTF